MSTEPVFALLLPEHLPSRHEVCDYVRRDLRGLPPVAATATGAGDMRALRMLRQLLAAVPVPADAREADSGPSGSSGSSGNRDNDAAFGIIRMDGNRPQLLMHSVLAVYEAVLDDMVRNGTGLSLPEWRRLRDGLNALLGYIADFDVTGPVNSYPPVAAGRCPQPPDVLRRWVRGHHLFMVIMQGLALALAELEEAARRARGAETAQALDLAVMLMQSSESALRFAADFEPDEYSDVVRPTMMPPAAPPGLSGLHWRDHEYLLLRLARVRHVLAASEPALVSLRQRFRAAYEAVYDAHSLVCARFGGDSARSLLMTEKSKQTAVGVLSHYKRARLQNIPD